MLRPPVEPEQYTAIRYGEKLAEAGIQPSIGSVGDSFDNALAESTIGLFKTELVQLHGPWHTRTETELAVLEYINWFNTARLHGQLQHTPPRKYEQAHYRQHHPEPGRGPKPHMTPSVSRRRS